MSEKPEGNIHAETPVFPEIFEDLDATISVDPLGEQGAYALTFKGGDAIVTIRISFDDYSGAELMITHMTTLPYDKTGRGHGSAAVEKLVAWAQSKGIHDIRATQIHEENESFWQSNGFVKMPSPNPTNDHTWVGAD